MKCKCDNCILPKTSFFNLLSPEQLVTINSITEPIVVKKNQVIFSENQVSEKIYIVKKGEIKLSKKSDVDKDIIMQIVSAGQILGISSIFEDIYTETAAALTRTELCAINKPSLYNVLIHDKKMFIALGKVLSAELRKTEFSLTNIKTKSSMERLASYFVEEYQIHQMPTVTIISFKLALSRQEIADYIGVAPETISRLISSLPEEVISLKGKYVTIKDIKKLKEIARWKDKEK